MLAMFDYIRKLYVLLAIVHATRIIIIVLGASQHANRCRMRVDVGAGISTQLARSTASFSVSVLITASCLPSVSY